MLGRERVERGEVCFGFFEQLADLRGDRLQAEVGSTMGPLGERFDLAMRTVVLKKLTLRALAEPMKKNEYGQYLLRLAAEGRSFADWDADSTK